MSKSVFDCTTNYEMFIHHSHNRNIEKLNSLVKSMKEHGFISGCAIHCSRIGDFLEIKRGHHRFEAAKILNLPVWYIVSNDNASIYELETTQKNWSTLDYVTAYAKTGKSNYALLLIWLKRTNFPISMLASALAGECAVSANKNDSIKKGTYETTKEGVIHCNILYQSSLSISVYNKEIAIHSHFIKALSRMIFVKEFDMTRFLSKLKTFHYLLKKELGIQGYSDLIEKIYNYKCKPSDVINLTFLAKKIMSERNPVNL